jgi:hypothetical protein
MAELTKAAVRQSVLGDQIKITATITGASGSTYTTNLANLFKADTSPGTAVTAVAFSGGTATFTSSGNMTGEIIALWGR